MKAAKAAGAICSFDLNFREKLWNIWGGAHKAAEVVGRIVANADVLVGNEEDLQKGLNIAGQDVEKRSKLDPARSRHDRQGHGQVSASQGRVHDPARGGLDQPPRLGAVAW